VTATIDAIAHEVAGLRARLHDAEEGRSTARRLLAEVETSLAARDKENELLKARLAQRGPLNSVDERWLQEKRAEVKFDLSLSDGPLVWLRMPRMRAIRAATLQDAVNRAKR
jgi:hypothetical protein